MYYFPQVSWPYYYQYTSGYYTDDTYRWMTWDGTNSPSKVTGWRIWTTRTVWDKHFWKFILVGTSAKCCRPFLSDFYDTPDTGESLPQISPKLSQKLASISSRAPPCQTSNSEICNVIQPTFYMRYEMLSCRNYIWAWWCSLVGNFCENCGAK